MFRSALLGLLAASVLGACDDAPAGRPTAASDALWKMAPEGTRGAIVMSPYAVGMIEAGSVSIRDFLAKAGPELAPIAGMVGAALEPVGGKDVKLADFGMSATKGAAFFAAHKSYVAVLPVTDRDKFLEKVHGKKAPTPEGTDEIGPIRCKMSTTHYLCGGNEELLANVGKSQIKDRILKVGTRGDIEVVMTELPVQGLDMPRGAMAATVQLERGAVTVHGTFVNPPKLLSDMVTANTKPRARIGKSAGFAMIDLRTLFEASDRKLYGDVTGDQLMKSIAGPLTVEVPPGTHVLDVQMPLSDPKPFTQIVEHCDEVPDIAGLGAKKIPGGCQLALAQLGLEIDLWVEGNTLRAGKKGWTAPDTSVAMTPIGTELANGQWGLVFWGRGTMFAGTERPPQDVPQIDPRVAAQLRAFAMIDELGFGAKKDGDMLRFVGTLRTAFSNPDPVIAKLLSITALDIAGNKADAKAKPIAAEFARSPFAADLAAGEGGLVIPMQMASSGFSWIVQSMLYYAQSDPDAKAPPTGPAAEQAPDNEQPQFAPGQLTTLRVKGYATDGYKIWKEKNPGKTCPGSMKELAAAIDPTAIYTDEWGKEMVMVCGGKLPAAANGIAVMSAGPDGKVDTADDIKSY